MSRKDRRTVLKQSGAAIVGLAGLSQTGAADPDGDDTPKDIENWPVTLEDYVDSGFVLEDCPTITKGQTYTFKNLEFELTHGDLRLSFCDGYCFYRAKTVEYDGTYNVDAPVDIPFEDSYVGVDATGDGNPITDISGKVQPIWMD